MSTMKAVTISRYGGPEVLEYQDLPPPSPKDGEVVVKVRASNVNPIDWRIRDGALKMFIRAPFPMILGVDLAGEIVQVGAAVKRLSVGDAVFAMMPKDIGAQAELVAVDAGLVVPKPRNMTMEEAATVPAVALTALQALRDIAHVQPGQRVLVNGASGGVGLFAVQLGKVLGASVTAVAGAASFEMVKGLGADALIDYRKTDFTAGKEKYDVVFDCVGTRSAGECAPILRAGGVYINTSAMPGLFLRRAFNFLFSVKAYPILVASKGADLDYIRSLIEEGRLRTVIDRTFPVAEIAEAQMYSKTGRAKGKIVLTFA
jgi:NADPH:quinone reductase-like Zn-dependent oxidoreductase